MNLKVFMKLKVVMLLLAIPLIFSGCAKKEELSKPYIYVFASDSKDTNIYSVDINSQKSFKTASLNDFTKEPSAVYSKDDNTVYYAQRIEREDFRGVELYAVDADTNIESQLTDNLWDINDIISAKDNIYLLAVTTDDNHLKPMIYHKDTKKLEILNKDTDLNFNYISYDVKTNHLYASGFMLEELQKAMEEDSNNAYQNPARMFNWPDSYIYDFTEDFKNPKQLFKIEKADITNLCAIPGGEKIYYGQNDDLIRSTYILDIKENTNDTYYSFPEEFDVIQQFTFINEDEALFIGENPYNKEEYPRGIYLYNVKTKETKLIFSTENEEIFKFQLTTD